MSESSPKANWHGLAGRVQKRLDETDQNAARASLDAGLHIDFIRNILKKRVKRPNVEDMFAVARQLQSSVEYLIGLTDEIGQPPAEQSKVTQTYDLWPLRVRHDVAAGVWRELDDLSQVELPLSPLRSDPQWPASEQWVAKVVGDSMNEIYPEDTYVRLVSVFAIHRYQPKTGHHVEVVRKREGGLLREVTLKEIRVNADGSIDLICRSSNPRWKDPIPYKDGIRPADGEAEVVITGVVTGDFRARDYKL